MDAARPPGSDATPSALWRRAIALAAIAVLSGAALHLLGRARRVIGPGRPVSAAGAEVLLVRRNGAVLEAWRERGLRGRVVVHVGRFLHFVAEDDPAEPAAALHAPRHAGARNHLRVAAETGIARRIVYVIPPAALAARLRAEGADPALPSLAFPAEAFPRAIAAAPPASDEPVLLDVNASWFDEATPEALLAALRDARLASDLVTLSLAEDAGDVSDRARDGLRRFAANLAAASAGGVAP